MKSSKFHRPTDGVAPLAGGKAVAADGDRLGGGHACGCFLTKFGRVAPCGGYETVAGFRSRRLIDLDIDPVPGTGCNGCTGRSGVHGQPVGTIQLAVRGFERNPQRIRPAPHIADINVGVGQRLESDVETSDNVAGR